MTSAVYVTSAPAPIGSGSSPPVIPASATAWSSSVIVQRAVASPSPSRGGEAGGAWRRDEPAAAARRGGEQEGEPDALRHHPGGHAERVPGHSPQADARQPKMSGYELAISMDIFRGRYRKSLSHPSPLTPNKPLVYRWALPAADHVFLPGHRIMIQIQSSWFPLYDRNPQTFVGGGPNFDIDFSLLGPDLESLAAYAERLRERAGRALA